MKQERLFLFLSILGVLILLVFVSMQKPLTEGKISIIKTQGAATIISLENSSEKIILLNKTPLDFVLLKNDNIKVYGQKIKNTNETVIFVDTIILRK